MIFLFGHAQAFLEDPIGGTIYFLILWISIFGAGIIGILKVKSKLSNITSILFSISVVLVVLPLIGIANYQISSFYFQDTLSPDNHKLSFDSSTIYKPDIYYLVFDRYASSNTLDDVYNFNNSEFLDYLKGKGFYVLSESKSNYPNSVQSLASSLNMIYINNLSDKSGKLNKEAITIELLQSCEVCKLLKSNGYTYFHFGSWHSPTSENSEADVNVNYFRDRIPDFTILLYKTTFLYPFSANYLDNEGNIGLEKKYQTGYNNDFRLEQYQRILFQFDKLKEIPKIKEPTFVFAHMIIPHEPFVFDKDGNYLSIEDVSGKPYKEKYINQLIFLNKKIKNLVAQILENSENPPIIILQADEGPYPYAYYIIGKNNFEWGEMNIDDLETKFGILNALYLPGVDENDLYPSISSVNTFRFIFNQYFNANIDLLPDHHYNYKDIQHTYQFINITDKITNKFLKNVDLEKNFTNEISWQTFGIEYFDQEKYDYISDLLKIYYQREDLQRAFPDVAQGDLAPLFIWASEHGVKNNTEISYSLEKHEPIYDLMLVYLEGIIPLKNAYPEAKNGVNIDNLICWAKNYGVFESNLAKHESYYNSHCSI